MTEPFKSIDECQETIRCLLQALNNTQQDWTAGIPARDSVCATRNEQLIMELAPHFPEGVGNDLFG